MTPVWMPALVCACGATTPAGFMTEAPPCSDCGRTFPSSEGVLQCLSADRRAKLRAFLDQYRAVRARDGYARHDAAFYRALPDVANDDPQRAVWRLRQRSFAELLCFLNARPRQPATVLDLGAGNGWLCHRLSLAGCRVVAVDVLDDECDGLGAARHYDVAFARIRADFDELPLAPRQFDVVVFNGSLHYAPNIGATLAHAAQCLVGDGALAVLDSPTFAHAADGERMRARLRDRFRRENGIADPVLPGAAYVTLGALAASAGALGLSPRFSESTPVPIQAWRSLKARALNRAQSPRFGLWVAA
jgi:SAM-dependent methyltransferase